MKAILLTEHYEGKTSQSMLLNYNLLPLNTKELIDEAIHTRSSIETDVYENGLQSLDFEADYNIINILPVTITEIIQVEFYHFG